MVFFREMHARLGGCGPMPDRGRWRWLHGARTVARALLAAYACRERVLPVQRSVMSRVATMAVMVVVALSCVVGFVQPAMAAGGGQDCLGPGCQDQISCGQPAQPQASSGSSVQPVALPAAVGAGPAPERTEPPAIGPPPIRVAWQSVARLAPRSPPAV